MVLFIGGAIPDYPDDYAHGDDLSGPHYTVPLLRHADNTASPHPGSSSRVYAR